MKTRRLAAASYAALKTRTRLLIEALGGFEAAASATRVNPVSLHNYCSAGHPDSFVPADVLMDLETLAREQRAGGPFVTDALALSLRHQLLPLEPAGEGSSARAVAEVLRGAGDLAVAWAGAMEDGAVTEAERADLLARLTALQRAATAAAAMLAQPVPPITTAGQRKLGLVA